MPMNRRTLLATGAAATLLPAMPRAARAQSTGPGAAMRERAVTLLNTLNADQRAAATFPFGSDTRIGWNFMLASRRAPGLALEQMTAPQKDAALDLLATGTSQTGLEKAMNIMLQQDILRDEWGKGSPDRNRERFSIMIFGTPSATDPWGWRWEGHHLSLSFTLEGDQVISTTPSAFSSEPNTVPSGPYEGLVVLKEEETLGRALFTDLSEANRLAAMVNLQSPGNILTTNGRERRYDGDTRGVRLADLTTSQRDMALRLIEVYAIDPLPGPLADAQRARLTGSDPMATRFIWAGADLDGSIYYRLHGDALLIEFASLRNQPQHLHAVFHDIDRNFGRHTL